MASDFHPVIFNLTRYSRKEKYSRKENVSQVVYFYTSVLQVQKLQRVLSTQKFIFMSLSQESYQRINFTQSRIDLKTIAKGLTRITVFKYRTLKQMYQNYNKEYKYYMVQQYVQIELKTWKEKNEKLFLDKVTLLITAANLL